MRSNFSKLKEKDLLFVLKTISEEDCMYEDFLDLSILEDFLIVLTSYDLVYEASDGRIMLTYQGQKLLQTLSTPVDFNTKSQ